eukprot:6485638-Amphidinium_carterae.1
MVLWGPLLATAAMAQSNVLFFHSPKQSLLSKEDQPRSKVCSVWLFCQIVCSASLTWSTSQDKRTQINIAITST